MDFIAHTHFLSLSLSLFIDFPFSQIILIEKMNYSNLLNYYSTGILPAPSSSLPPPPLLYPHPHQILSPSPPVPQSYLNASSYGNKRRSDTDNDLLIKRFISNNYELNNIVHEPEISTRVLEIELNLLQRLKPLQIPPPVSYIYSPLEYAFETHQMYVRKYCNNKKKLLFLGMNPGPWGQSQTGVPFGEVNLVKNWLKIEGRVGKPLIEHPSRIIEGFNCPRSEVSGQRFWSYFKDLCVTPSALFKNAYVHNYCPLAFMKDSGRNLTPPELKAKERNQLFECCDEALIKVIRLLGIEIVIGVGKFPQQRTLLALQNSGINGIRVESILHPSPVNPTANKGWREVIHKQLVDIGVIHLIT